MKDRIFMPDYDSYNRMLEELGIEDNYINASKTFVRVELSPEDRDPFTNIDEWKLNIDQDIKPDWFNADETKEKMKKQVKEWAKTHLFYNIDGLDVCSGENIYIKDCKNVSIYGNAKVDAIYGNSQVNYISGNAIIGCIRDNAKVDHIDYNVKVNSICGNAIIDIICDNAKVNYICGNTIIDSIWGNAKVNDIYDNAIIEAMYNLSLVNYIHGDAEIRNIFNGSVVRTDDITPWNRINNTKVFDNAIIIDTYRNQIHISKKCRAIQHEMDYNNNH